VCPREPRGRPVAGRQEAQTRDDQGTGEGLGADRRHEEGLPVPRGQGHHASRGGVEGGVGEFLRTWAKASWRLRTPLNDIRIRDIGEGGIIFDLALPPFEQALEAGYATAAGYGAYELAQAASDDE
jgi:hypothetical protein